MKGTIALNNPIEICGKTVCELPYDTELLTVEQFSRADGMAKSSSQSPIGLAEFDYSLQFYLGAFSVIAADASIDIADVERVCGADIMKVMRVGRFLAISLDESEQSGSDDASVSTPERSTAPSRRSSEQGSKNS